MLKNIVILNDFAYAEGGASRVSIDYANLLCEDYKVTFFAGNSDKMELDNKIKLVTLNQNPIIHSKNKIKGFFNGVFNLKALKELKDILKEFSSKETIIIIHGWTKILSPSIFFFLKKSKFKHFLVVHDFFLLCGNGAFYNFRKCEKCDLNKTFLGCVMENCDSRNYIYKLYRIFRLIFSRLIGIPESLSGLIFISDFSKNIFFQKYRKKVNYFRINNPVLTESKKRVEVEKNYHIGYLGRLEKEKGIEIFMEIINKTGKNGIVIGDGSLKNDLLSKNCIFTGWLSKEDMNEYIKKFRVMIFPTNCYETMGMVVLESFSYGIPVIAPENSAASDFILHKKTGFLYKEKSEIYEFLRLIDNEKIVKDMSEKCFNYFYENYKSKFFDSFYKFIEIVGWYNK